MIRAGGSLANEALRGLAWRDTIGDMGQGDQVWHGLVDGRNAVARALLLGSYTDLAPDEETLTWELLSAAVWRSSVITARRFTRHEESNYTGADWIWWWEGPPGEWFGCLVQAKRLTAHRDGPRFDYSYTPTRDGAMPQVDQLIAAADHLDIPAAYVLYWAPNVGSPGPWACGAIAPDFDAAAVTFIAAGVVHEWLAMGYQPNLRLLHPLECLACDQRCDAGSGAMSWYSHTLGDARLRSILLARPDTAAKSAFRALFSSMAMLRNAQMSAPANLDTADTTHSGFPLTEHFVRGFRGAPHYVEAILAGESPDLGGLEEHAAGVVVVRSPGQLR